MTEVLLDTDILSFYLRGDENVIRHVEEYLSSYKNLNTSIITFYEVLSGLKHRDAQKQLTTFLEIFCCPAIDGGTEDLRLEPNRPGRFGPWAQGERDGMDPLCSVLVSPAVVHDVQRRRGKTREKG